MRKVRYNVAASLDGFIAGPHGEYDWIPEEPNVDFAAIFANVDTVLLGRDSFLLTQKQPELPWYPGTRIYVFSTTLDPNEYPGVTVVARDAAAVVAELREEPGTGDIWLFGGGKLFASLLDAGQVDRIEVTVVPVLIGSGIQLAPAVRRAPLNLLRTHTYPSGMVTLEYDVCSAAGH